MRKSIKIIFCSIFVLLVFVIVLNSFTEESSPLSINTKLENVTMTVEQQTFPIETEAIVATVANNTEHEIFTGEHFSIEYFDGNQWVELPASDNFAFIDIEVPIQAFESKDFQIWLEAFPPEESGLYRVRKSVFPDYMFRSDTGHDLVVEFYLS